MVNRHASSLSFELSWAHGESRNVLAHLVTGAQDAPAHQSSGPIPISAPSTPARSSASTSSLLMPTDFAGLEHPAHDWRSRGLASGFWLRGWQLACSSSGLLADSGLLAQASRLAGWGLVDRRRWLLLPWLAQASGGPCSVYIYFPLATLNYCSLAM